MKQCPTCHSQYTDDTLQFCLQDGSPLYLAGANTEQETFVAGRQSDQIGAPPATSPTGWNPNQSASNPSVQPMERNSSPTVLVLLTVFIMLLLFSFVGIGAWLYFRGAANDDSGNIFIAKRSNSNTASNTSTAPDTVKTTPMATTTPLTSANTNSAPVDKEQIKRDVSQRVYSWKSAAEARNLDSYMSHYASTVDYYNKRGASVGFVRADKQRAFTSYDSIRITLSNMTVMPDASGDGATAVFDKEWVFDGAKYSAGKVQTQLKLKKVNGQWLISGERDLKVYYTE